MPNFSALAILFAKGKAMNSVEKVKKLCKERNVTLAKLERDLGFANAYIAGLKKGTIPDDRLVKIAKYFDVWFGELIGDDELKSMGLTEWSYKNIKPITTQALPMLGSIACGEPVFMGDSEISLYTEVGSDIKADFCLRCKGDSMINARINDGDIVFIRSDAPFVNGKIYAVAIDDEATLKRVYRTEDAVTLLAENPAYLPIIVKATDAKNIRIMGMAVAFQGNL